MDDSAKLTVELFAIQLFAIILRIILSTRKMTKLHSIRQIPSATGDIFEFIEITVSPVNIKKQ